MPKLGVNIDHVATLRQARKGLEPEPVFAALISESAGADSIVAHLREDRRHINDRDVYLLKETIKTKFNLEMSINEKIVDLACNLKPDQSTLVPEKRQELTTEGGLDVAGNLSKIKKTCEKLSFNDIQVSLFIDPEKKQINAAKKAGVKIIELHTGRYAESKSKSKQEKYYKEIISAAQYAAKRGFVVCAGHGLNYFNVSRIAKIKEIEELNIGYSIICRSVYVGLGRAVSEMKLLL